MGHDWKDCLIVDNLYMQETHVPFAQLQCVSWGMALPTGIPTLDGEGTGSISLEEVPVKKEFGLQDFDYHGSMISKNAGRIKNNLIFFFAVV